MRLISWNVNGLRSVCAKGLYRFVAREKPDILCLQETKLQHEHLDYRELVPPGYDSYFFSAKKKGYSGVCIFFRDDLSPAPKNLRTGIGDGPIDDEGRVLAADLPQFTLYNIYFPSGTMGEERQNFKYRFLDLIYRHFSSVKQKKSNLLVCGDFNICHRPIDIHHPEIAEARGLSGFLPEERKWMDSFLALGFEDTFRRVNGDIPDRYTWWSFRAQSRQKNLGWRIDYFFASAGLANSVINADILGSVSGSDHCPIVIELQDT